VGGYYNGSYFVNILLALIASLLQWLFIFINFVLAVVLSIGGYVVGVAMILAAFFNAYVICAHPEFTSKLGAFSDPTNGNKTAEQLAQGILRTTF
jgi:UDP-N-acetylglucosamine:LPS N-acetylglucosamine transferase